jgi:hypothetical protein
MAATEELRRALSELQRAKDVADAKAKGISIVGYARPCRCGGRAYHSPRAIWQNRVVCLSCGRKWSE